MTNPSFLGMQKDADASSSKKVGTSSEPCSEPPPPPKTKPPVTVKIQEAPEARVVLPPKGQAAATLTLHAIHAEPSGGDFVWRLNNPGAVNLQGPVDGSSLNLVAAARGTADVDVKYTYDGQSAPDTAKVRVTAPIIDVDPSRLDFKIVDLGKESDPQLLTIKNTGDATLTLNSLAPESDKHFQIANPDQLQKPLAPGDPPLKAKLVFKPQEEGERATNLVIRSNAANESEILVPLVGKTPELLLKLVQVDHHFAPKVQKLDIAYELKGFHSDSKTVTLEINSKRCSSNPVYKRDLTLDEKKDASATIQWDGKLDSGEYINAACSPYEVHLFHNDKYTGTKEFRVLVHSIELKLGDFDKGIFDNEDTTNPGQRERLKALGYFYGDVTADDASDAAFKKAVEWFQSEKDSTAASKGVVGDSTKTAIKQQLPKILEGGELPTGAKKKIYVSGAFFYQATADLNANPPAGPRTNHRFTAEKTFWDDGLKLPVYAKIYLKNKSDGKEDVPEAVGPLKVLFEWIDASEHGTLAGKQKDYIEKAVDWYKATTNPSGEACHLDRGGKRGDDITKVFPENTDTSKFPFEVKKGSARTWAAVSTARIAAGDQKGMAGVIFRPSRMGGDGYQLRAYLHTEKDLDVNADKATNPDVETKTAAMLVWRPVRVNQVLHKPDADVNAIALATVNAEMAKAFMEFVGNLAKSDISEAVWTATVTAALTGDADFATIGKIDYASLNTIDFNTHADYTTAGGALSAADYNTLCEGKVWPWVERIIKEFAKDQYHGMTVIRAGWAHASYVTNSGVGFDNGVCYIWWPKSQYDAKGYVVEKYAAHEMGHCLYLRHHYTSAASGAIATWPASDNPDDHDKDDNACALSYFQTAWHFCGKCILKLRGWDEAVLEPDPDDANKKP